MTHSEWKRLAWGSGAALVVAFLLALSCRLGDWAARCLMEGYR